MHYLPCKIVGGAASRREAPVSGRACAAAIVAAVGLGVAIESADANDTVAGLTTGGLVFRTTKDIEMRAEDLSISRKKISVRYRFFNRSAADQTVTVAFPLPEVGFQEYQDVDVPNGDADNFLNFRTIADGREISARLEQKAFLGKREVTARLQALNVPLQPRAARTAAALDALSKDVQRQLIKEKLARSDDQDSGKGPEHHLAPEWTVKTTYFWRQTFPAGREVVIEHSYAPSVWSTVQTSIGSTLSDATQKAEYDKRFCVDSGMTSGVAALTKKNQGQPPPEYRIAYVLKTGANWAGPIGDFRLTIDKGEANALVSLCETNVVKTGPTTFEVRKTNFTPARDLNILIVALPTD